MATDVYFKIKGKNKSVYISKNIVKGYLITMIIKETKGKSQLRNVFLNCLL